LKKSEVSVNTVHRSRLSFKDKIALEITKHVGSMGFFLILFIWIIWNSLVPQPYKFDPSPAFVVLLFITNVLNMLLMPLIMVGQNLQGRHSDLRAEYDFETNKTLKMK
jgi:uncharacterized membrane protein